MMAKLKAVGRANKVLLGLVLVTLVIALILTSPWYIPWLVWTRGRTNYVSSSLTPYYAVDKFDTNYTVPKIIHQTWKDSNVPQKWQAARQSCIDLHPDYEYKLWTDVSADAFIQGHYPELARTYMKYPYVIQRADAISSTGMESPMGHSSSWHCPAIKPLAMALHSSKLPLPTTVPAGAARLYPTGRHGSRAASPKHPKANAFGKRESMVAPEQNKGII
ncbi:MAG: MIPC synthase [Trebouxia sp. A1-2]|nr:MAG: MIPC synthase [Trebouxia sp. A1-2]